MQLVSWSNAHRWFAPKLSNEECHERRRLAARARRTTQRTASATKSESANDLRYDEKPKSFDASKDAKLSVRLNELFQRPATSTPRKHVTLGGVFDSTSAGEDFKKHTTNDKFGVSCSAVTDCGFIRMYRRHVPNSMKCSFRNSPVKTSQALSSAWYASRRTSEIRSRASPEATASSIHPRPPCTTK